MTRYDRHSILLAIELSCLAGFVDALGVLSLGNFFVSFMSGNSTRLGIGAGQGRFGYVIIAGTVVALFVVGVVLGTLARRRAKRSRRAIVLFLVAMLLALAALLHGVGQPHWGTAAMLMAMGAENAVFQREGEVTLGVTYMTGTLVKLGQSIADLAQGGDCLAWLPYALLWLGLVVGASLGAVAHDHLGMRGLWPAVLGALVLAAQAGRTRSTASNS